MDFIDRYEAWLASCAVDSDTKKELEGLRGNQEEIHSRFSGLLEFGTAGLRGIMGAGLSRMNIYTVRHATQAIASILSLDGERAKKDGVAIAYDCRENGQRFAFEAASVLAANGITARVFESVRPTPELSFAVRYHGCAAGINITASHNTKEYNGYKVYWRDGGQIGPEIAQRIQREIKKLDIFSDVKTMPIEEAREKGLILIIGEETDEAYKAEVMAQSVRPSAETQPQDLSVVFTPFHGTGYELVPAVLTELGVKQLYPVEAQLMPDGSFPTVKSPNPEDTESFKMAIDLAREKRADIILGTDPDADRVGVVVRSGSEYLPLTGNQTGVLLLDYILSSRAQKGTLPERPCAVKTIVSTELARRVCEAYSVALIDVLTGFKFIAEKILEFEQTGRYSYVFGFEESYGYLSGTYVRDKDAVSACLLIAEMAAFYKRRGMTLIDALNSLFARFGYHAEKTVSITVDGEDALGKMGQTMKRLRDNLPAKIAGARVLKIGDYRSGLITDMQTGKTSSTGLPISDVLLFETEDETRLIVRPSGTEPKIKLYIMSKGDTAQKCSAKIEACQRAFSDLLI